MGRMQFGRSVRRVLALAVLSGLAVSCKQHDGKDDSDLLQLPGLKLPTGSADGAGSGSQPVDSNASPGAAASGHPPPSPSETGLPGAPGPGGSGAALIGTDESGEDPDGTLYSPQNPRAAAVAFAYDAGGISSAAGAQVNALPQVDPRDPVVLQGGNTQVTILMLMLPDAMTAHADCAFRAVGASEGPGEYGAVFSASGQAVWTQRGRYCYQTEVKINGTSSLTASLAVAAAVGQQFARF